jgi:hypothetical protein
MCALNCILQIEDDGIRSRLPGLLEAIWPVPRHEEIAATDHKSLLALATSEA